METVIQQVKENWAVIYWKSLIRWFSPNSTEFKTYLRVMFTHGVQVRGHRIKRMRP